MKSSEKLFQKNIENLGVITLKGDEDNYYREVIRALSFFLSKTNKNYYYTETYLNDNYNNFKSFLEKFSNKNNFSCELLKYLEKHFRKTNNELEVIIVIDNIWKFKYNENIWISEIEKNGNLNSLLEKTIHVNYTLHQGGKTIEMSGKIYIKSDKETHDIETCKDIKKNLLKYYEILES